VETHEDHYEIYYTRRGEKKGKLSDQSLTININEFIIKDSIAQIQHNFDYLWKKLEDEIEDCLKNYEKQN
jgi:hypothetical protein